MEIGLNHEHKIYMENLGGLLPSKVLPFTSALSHRRSNLGSRPSKRRFPTARTTDRQGPPRNQQSKMEKIMFRIILSLSSCLYFVCRAVFNLFLYILPDRGSTARTRSAPKLLSFFNSFDFGGKHPAFSNVGLYDMSGLEVWIQAGRLCLTIRRLFPWGTKPARKRIRWCLKRIENRYSENSILQVRFRKFEGLTKAPRRWWPTVVRLVARPFVFVLALAYSLA